MNFERGLAGRGVEMCSQVYSAKVSVLHMLFFDIQAGIHITLLGLSRGNKAVYGI